MQTIKLALLSIITVLLVGCATTSDIENLQTQVDGLKTSVAQVSSDVQAAHMAAANASASASASATAAEIAATHAAKNAQETSIKLGHLFKKALMK